MIIFRQGILLVCATLCQPVVLAQRNVIKIICILFTGRAKRGTIELNNIKKYMDNKKNRQYRLHQALKSNRYPVSINQLSEQLETSDKTLYRDIQEFRDLYHAPIVLNNGYLSYDKTSLQHFELPGIWFSDDELQALLAAQQLLSQIQPGLLDMHISPLKQFIVGMLSQHGHATEQSLKRIRILGIGQRSRQTQHFNKIAAGVLDRTQIKIDYLNRQTTELSQRQISPQRLIYYRNNWYLDAWCHLKKALRTFSLDNIKKAELEKQRAEDVDEKQLEEHYESAFGIFSGVADQMAKLKFSKPSANYIAKENWHPQQMGEWHGEVYIVNIPYHNPTELIMDILKYGADVQVLEPASLKLAVKREIGRMAEIYKTFT